jgi:plasminogen activator inhibitor 1 RNA-binding protein
MRPRGPTKEWRWRLPRAPRGRPPGPSGAEPSVAADEVMADQEFGRADSEEDDKKDLTPAEAVTQEPGAPPTELRKAFAPAQAKDSNGERSAGVAPANIAPATVAPAAAPGDVARRNADRDAKGAAAAVPGAPGAGPGGGGGGSGRAVEPGKPAPGFLSEGNANALKDGRAADANRKLEQLDQKNQDALQREAASKPAAGQAAPRAPAPPAPGAAAGKFAAPTEKARQDAEQLRNRAAKDEATGEAGAPAAAAASGAPVTNGLPAKTATGGDFKRAAQDKTDAQGGPLPTGRSPAARAADAKSEGEAANVRGEARGLGNATEGKGEGKGKGEGGGEFGGKAADADGKPNTTLAAPAAVHAPGAPPAGPVRAINGVLPKEPKEAEKAKQLSEQDRAAQQVQQNGAQGGGQVEAQRGGRVGAWAMTRTAQQADVLVLKVQVPRQAWESGAFDDVLISNSVNLSVESSAPELVLSEQQKNYRQAPKPQSKQPGDLTKAEPGKPAVDQDGTPDAGFSDALAAPALVERRREQVEKKSGGDKQVAEAAGMSEAVYLEATPQQVEAILADLRKRPESFLAVNCSTLPGGISFSAAQSDEKARKAIGFAGAGLAGVGGAGGGVAPGPERKVPPGEAAEQPAQQQQYRLSNQAPGAALPPTVAATQQQCLQIMPSDSNYRRVLVTRELDQLVQTEKLAKGQEPRDDRAADPAAPPSKDGGEAPAEVLDQAREQLQQQLKSLRAAPELAKADNKVRDKRMEAKLSQVRQRVVFVFEVVDEAPAAAAARVAPPNVVPSADPKK